MPSKKPTHTPQKVVVEPSTLLSEFDVLSRRSIEINELLNLLEERLSPILYIAPPGDPCPGADDNGPALRVAIRHAQAHADNIALRIRSLIERIDL